MLVNVSGRTLWATPSAYFKEKAMKSFDRSCENAQDENEWRLRIKILKGENPANPGVAEKRSWKRCVFGGPYSRTTRL